MKRITLLFVVLVFVASNLFAQFTQYTTTNTGAFANIIHDPDVEGRIYGFNLDAEPKVFVSEDYGVTWRLLFTFVDDPELLNGLSSQAYYPADHFAAGNGNVYVILMSSTSYATDGLYAINGITGEFKHYPAPRANEGSWVTSYSVYDKDDDVILLTTALNYGSSTEIYYTTDGGENWTSVYHSDDYSMVNVNKVMISPDNPKKLYMARDFGPSGVNGGFFTSNDAGETWTESLNGNTLQPIAINPHNPNEILTGVGIHRNISEALFRSRDGGYTWEEIPVEWKPYQAYSSDNIWDIKYDPNDPNKIIIIEENQLIITRDGFNTYEDITINPGNSYNVLVSLSINPFNGEEVFFSVDGKSTVHSTNSGRTRTSFSSKATSYGCISASVGQSGSDSYVYYILNGKCYRRNISTDASTNINANGADQVIADATMGDRAFLINTSTNTISFLENASASHSISAVAQDVKKIVRDPNNASVYWAAMNGSLSKIDISNLSNITVTAVSTPSGEDVTGIYVLLGNSSEIYIAQGNKVYKTTNGGANWTEKSTGLGSSTITDMVSNPLNANELMLSAGSNIYLSSDKAELWSSLLSGVAINKLAFSPNTSGVLAASSYTSDNKQAAIIYSTDNGTSWSQIEGKTLHNAQSSSMDFYFGESDYLNTYIASIDMGLVRYKSALDCSDQAIVTYPYLQGFENSSMLPCWTQETISGSANWSIVSKTTGNPATTPDDSEQKLRFVHAGSQNTVKMITSTFDLSSVDNPKLSFSYSKTGSANGNALRVYYKEGASAAWTELAVYSENTSDWTEVSLLLPNKSNQYQIAFEAETSDACNIQIDNMSVKSSILIPCNPPRSLTRILSNSYGCQMELAWNAPEGNYQANYNIYRDGVLIAAAVSNTFYTDDSFESGEEHEWTVKAICLEGESEGVSLTATCSDECMPPKNVGFEMINAIDGTAIINISWELPEGYDKAIFNVYRDNQLIASETSETSFVDDNVTNGEHTWSVAAICNGEESDRVSETFVCENQCAPIKNLDITYDVENTEVALNWVAPGDLPGGWISYGNEPVNGINDQALYPYTFTVAVRWSAEDLQAMGLDGTKLSEVAYVPWSNAPTYYVSVWTGGNDSAAGTLEVERTVSGQGLNAKEWNTIALNTPLIIDATKELRIGIRINYAGGEVVGCDNATAPEADGKSNLIMKSNVWQKLTDVDPAYTYNLCIGGNIIDAEGRSINLNRASRGGNVTEYSVYRDGELLTTTTSTSYSETGLVEDIYTYCVTASYDNGCVSEEVCEDFFAGNPCPAVENVTATTTSEWPACEVEITWDAADPMYSPEVVFYESFNSGVPSTWSNLDKDGDERKWRSSMEEDGWYTYSPPIALEGYCIASEHTYLDDEGYYQTAFADNWMVTPAIKLTHGSAVLNYWVAQLYGYPTDTYYEVLVSTTGTDYDDFTRIYSEYMPSTGYTIIWNEKNIDLSAYTGDVYVAFRHYNVGEYESAVGIQLDEVKVIEQTPSDRLYNVYRDETLIAANVLATSFVDDDFESGTHEWSVTAICNEFGHESNPASATVSCDQGESINEPNSEKMMIYPNPTTGKVTVESNSETIKCIYILDVAGKVIDGLDNINRNKTEIDLTGLSKGIYFLKINEQIDKVIKK